MAHNSRTGASATLQVHVQPRARRTEVVGWHGDAIKIRVSAPPVEGAANIELVRLMARVTGVPRAAVRIVSGTSGRRKLIEVEGLTRNQLLVALGIKEA
jgi:uncharacterized protein (TIGR00251 family)